MEISEARQLANQLQQAHRFSAGFYQRFLPLVTDTAESLGYEFKVWWPQSFRRPSRNTKNPVDHWAWDLLPMAHTTFVFVKQKNEQTNIGDCVLEFQFVPDEQIIGQDDEPDPLSLEQNVIPQMKLYAYKVTKPQKISLYEVWNKVESWPDDGDESTLFDDGLEAVSRTVELAEFMINPQALVEVLLARLG